MKTINLADFTISNNNQLILIAGPCVIESEQHSLMMAEKITNICQKLNVKLIYKSSFDKANRSSINGIRGVGMDKTMVDFIAIKEQLGVKLLTDVHTEGHVSRVRSVVDVIQIPAFLCRQTDLVMAACATDCIVNIKKGQFLAPWDVESILSKTTGAKEVWITERGTSFGYNTLVVDFTGLDFGDLNLSGVDFSGIDFGNVDLSGVDLDRFENVLGLNFASDEVMSKPLGIIDDGMKMEFLGENDHAGFGTRGRTTQPQQAPAQDDDVTKEKPDTCGPETPLPNGVQGTAPTLGTYDAIDLPLSQNPNETPGKTLLSTAILAKLTGNDVGDAVKNYALTVVERELLKKTSNVASAPTRGSE